jgi:hypothetical protein
MCKKLNLTVDILNSVLGAVSATVSTGYGKYMGQTASAIVCRVDECGIDSTALQYLASLDAEEYQNVFALEVKRTYCDDAVHNVYYHRNESDDFDACVAKCKLTHEPTRELNRESTQPTRELTMYYVPTAGDTYCVVASYVLVHAYVVNLGDITRVAKCYCAISPVENLIECADLALNAATAKFVRDCEGL